MIEVVVALALTALLMSAILLVVRSEIGLSAAVRDSGRGYEAARTLATMLGVQLASASVPKEAGLRALEGDSRRVAFLTTVSRGGAAPQGRGVVRASYRAAGDGRLFYAETLLPVAEAGEVGGAAEGGGEERTLSAAMEEFLLAYLDAEGKEHDAWPPAEGNAAPLPAAVVVTFRPGGLGDPVVVVARVNR